MRKILLLIAIAFVLASCSTVPPPVVLSPPSAVVEVVEVTPDVSVGFSQKLDGWVVSADVPAYLLEETAHHIEHELKHKGITRSHDEIRDIALKRLAANELFIYNASSRAWIVIDFSPLREGEEPPSRQAVYNSARYAADSLAGEEGVSDVKHKVTAVALQSAEHAFRLDADYLSHGEKRKFVGIIGFANPYWVFVYYTDELRDPGDYMFVDAVLSSMTIVRK